MLLTCLIVKILKIGSSSGIGLSRDDLELFYWLINNLVSQCVCLCAANSRFLELHQNLNSQAIVRHSGGLSSEDLTGFEIWLKNLLQIFGF